MVPAKVMWFGSSSSPVLTRLILSTMTKQAQPCREERVFVIKSSFVTEEPNF